MWPLLWFGVSLGSAQAMPADNRVPEAEAIERLEARIVMPAGAGALDEYDRVYTEVRRDGRRTILGQFTKRSLSEAIARSRGKPPPPPILRGLLSDLSQFKDGGCATLSLTDDVGSGTAPSVSCGSTLTLGGDRRAR